MGHQRRKPTTLWADFGEVLQLAGLKDNRPGKPWPSSVAEAIEESRQLAAWAPQLKESIVVAVKRGCESPDVKMVGNQMRDQYDWYTHLAQDHFLARRDCVQVLGGISHERGLNVLRHLCLAWTLEVRFQRVMIMIGRLLSTSWRLW